MTTNTSTRRDPSPAPDPARDREHQGQEVGLAASESENACIRVRINGEIREVPTELTVAGLLSHLDIRTNRVAVERNRRIVSKSTFEKTPIEDGDQIEIVSFIGGG